jgi:hypothetical protein
MPGYLCHGAAVGALSGEFHHHLFFSGCLAAIGLPLTRNRFDRRRSALSARRLVSAHDWALCCGRGAPACGFMSAPGDPVGQSMGLPSPLAVTLPQSAGRFGFEPHHFLLSRSSLFPSYLCRSAGEHYAHLWITGALKASSSFLVPFFGPRDRRMRGRKTSFFWGWCETANVFAPQLG